MQPVHAKQSLSETVIFLLFEVFIPFDLFRIPTEIVAESSFSFFRNGNMQALNSENYKKKREMQSKTEKKIESK